MLKLGRVLDIPVEVHASWLIIFGLLSYGIGSDYIRQIHPETKLSVALGYGAAAAICLFICLLIHEFAHCVVARAYGIETLSITLFLFGGVAQFNREPDKWTHELRIALAGPAVNCICAAVFVIGWFLASQGTILETLAFYLAVSNLLLAAVNLLPGYPLDGGRAMRAILWGLLDSRLSATRVATTAGSVLGWIAGAMGIIAIVAYGDLSGAWWCLLGWFVASSASCSWEQEQFRDSLEKCLKCSIESTPQNVYSGIVDKRHIGRVKAYLVTQKNEYTNHKR